MDCGQLITSPGHFFLATWAGLIPGNRSRPRPYTNVLLTTIFYWDKNSSQWCPKRIYVNVTLKNKQKKNDLHQSSSCFWIFLWLSTAQSGILNTLPLACTIFILKVPGFRNQMKPTSPHIPSLGSVLSSDPCPQMGGQRFGKTVQPPRHASSLSGLRWQSPLWLLAASLPFLQCVPTMPPQCFSTTPIWDCFLSQNSVPSPRPL